MFPKNNTHIYELLYHSAFYRATCLLLFSSNKICSDKQRKVFRKNKADTFPVTPVTGIFSQLQSWQGFPSCFLLFNIDSQFICLHKVYLSFIYIAFSGKAATAPTRQNRKSTDGLAKLFTCDVLWRSCLPPQYATITDCFVFHHQRRYNSHTSKKRLSRKTQK